MLADDSAPAHADTLAECLSNAHAYAEVIRRMLADGKPDADRAAHLVQAIHNVILVALESLYELDDVQQAIDAADAIQGLTDAELYQVITDTPTSENP
ncbi:hypothetical protein [Streptomyces albus]|uniref:hypothetical protein n=1 Tax=Streptomyces albus TaxID=1888 RepID=UPI0033EA8A67